MPDSVAKKLIGLDGPDGWLTKHAKWLLEWISRNQLVAAVMVAIVGVYYVLEGQQQLIQQLRQDAAHLEERREKWADKHSQLFMQSFTQLGIEIDRLRTTVDRNTDAVRGKVFSPKTTPKKNEP